MIVVRRVVVSRKCPPPRAYYHIVQDGKLIDTALTRRMAMKRAREYDNHTRQHTTPSS